MHTTYAQFAKTFSDRMDMNEITAERIICRIWTIINESQVNGSQLFATNTTEVIIAGNGRKNVGSQNSSRMK